MDNEQQNAINKAMAILGVDGIDGLAAMLSTLPALPPGEHGGDDEQDGAQLEDAQDDGEQGAQLEAPAARGNGRSAAQRRSNKTPPRATATQRAGTSGDSRTVLLQTAAGLKTEAAMALRRAQVDALAILGMGAGDIARQLGISRAVVVADISYLRHFAAIRYNLDRLRHSTWSQIQRDADQIGEVAELVRAQVLESAGKLDQQRAGRLLSAYADLVRVRQLALFDAAKLYGLPSTVIQHKSSALSSALEGVFREVDPADGPGEVDGIFRDVGQSEG
jgi:hypothetical protein